MVIMSEIEKKIFLSQSFFFFLTKSHTKRFRLEVIYMITSNQMFTEILATAQYT